jgi:hypothetical protein
MRLTFRVILAVLAALTVSMTVSACNDGGLICNSAADCCPGYKCAKEQIVGVSMSSFIRDLLTHRRGRISTERFASLLCVMAVRIEHPLSTDQHHRIEPYFRSARDLQYE